MQADYTIHGGWGDHISWMDSFAGKDLNTETFRVYGHLPGKRPEVGDTLMGDFKKSYIKFVFLSVRHESDPPDMFFGEVKAIEQEMKPEG